MIPKPLRKSLGLRTGQELDLEERDGQIIIHPVLEADPIERLVGLVKEPIDVDEYLVSTRGPGEIMPLDGSEQ